MRLIRHVVIVDSLAKLMLGYAVRFSAVSCSRSTDSDEPNRHRECLAGLIGFGKRDHDVLQIGGGWFAFTLHGHRDLSISSNVNVFNVDARVSRCDSRLVVDRQKQSRKRVVVFILNAFYCCDRRSRGVVRPFARGYRQRGKPYLAGKLGEAGLDLSNFLLGSVDLGDQLRDGRVLILAVHGVGAGSHVNAYARAVYFLAGLIEDREPYGKIPFAGG